MKLWIAKDEDGELYMHFDKPIRDNDNGVFKTTNVGYCSVHLSEDAFWFLNKEVTWENSPREIEIKFVN